MKAVNKANENGGRIKLASRCTYTLTAPDNADDGLPEITGNVTVSGHDTTIRRASGATEDFRIFHVVSGGKLTVNSLTVRGGNVTDGNGGGALNEQGTLNLNASVFRGNNAVMGGGVTSDGGKLNLDRTTVERNTSTEWGGGVFNTGTSTMTMKDGSLTRNRAINNNGGGLENINGTARLHGVTVQGNTALLGGGIRQTQQSDLRLTSSSVRDNIAVAGGGMSNSNSTAKLIRSQVTRNTAITAGGGIVNENSGGVSLKDSRVVRNTPDNCSPEGSVPGCKNPTKAVTPPAMRLPSSTDDTKVSAD